MSPPAFRDEVITDLFNERGLKQGLTADEIEDDSLGLFADELPVILLIQIQDVIDDALAGFERHGLAAFVVLIAI